jgi:hypothetical protein
MGGTSPLAPAFIDNAPPLFLLADANIFLFIIFV